MNCREFVTDSINKLLDIYEYIVNTLVMVSIGIYDMFFSILLYGDHYQYKNRLETFFIYSWFVFTNMFHNWKYLQDIKIKESKRHGSTIHFEKCKLDHNNVHTVIKLLSHTQYYCQCKKIVFSKCHIDDNIFEKMFQNKKLIKKMKIVGTELKHNNAIHLIKMCRSGLSSLTIQCGLDYNMHFFDYYTHTSTLTELCIIGPYFGITSFDLKAINNWLQRVKTLRILKIDCKLYPSDFKNGCSELVNILKNNKTVTNFKYTTDSVYYNATENIIKYLANDTILESVSLTKSYNIDEHMLTDLIITLKHNSTIKKLNLQNSFCNDNYLVKFMKFMRDNKNITNLKISYRSHNWLSLLKYVENNYTLSKLATQNASEYLENRVNQITERNIRIKAENIKSARKN